MSRSTDSRGVRWLSVPVGSALVFTMSLCIGALAVQAAGVVGTGTPATCTEAMLDAALAAGGLVTFDCGPNPVTITLTSEKAIIAGTTIDGGGRITLSGGGRVRVFTVDEDAALDMRNLTIADGYPTSGIGPYYDVGGAIHNSGTLTLTNCTLRRNSSSGAGGAIHNSGTLTLTNCTLSGNSAPDCSLQACGGGAIYNRGALTLTNCTLSGNSAAVGGGIYNSYSYDPSYNVGTLTLTNCTLSGNSATGNCGDGGCGGGIVSDRFVSTTLRNTIVANSPSGGDCSGGVTDAGHNVIEDATHSCDLTNGVNGNIVGVDPLLDPEGLKGNGGPTQTIALLPGSPAIAAGDPDVCANPPVNGVDQRGFARPGSGHTQCSIGAYEADAVSPEPCVGDCDGTGSVTIDELLTLVNIALGNAQGSACPHGVPSGADVDVALIIQAVNNALNGCGSAAPATR